MDEQTQAVRIRRRRSRAEVERLVAEYEASGLDRSAFCQQRGLSLSTLARYRRRQGQTAAADEKRWLALEVSSGQRIEVSRGFDADTLQRLLAAMGRD